MILIKLTLTIEDDQKVDDKQEKSFVIEFTGDDPVAFAQLNLLRDAMLNDLKVRIMYEKIDSQDPRKQANSVIGVRIQKEPKSV